jgi:tRNA(fMet)-specific endonuclease VapC
LSYRFLLDTNIISEVNKKIPNQFVTDRMSRHQNEVATGSPIIHELLYGCLRLPIESKKRNFLLNYINLIPLKMPIFEYDLNAARWHAYQRERLSKIGKTPAFVDGQIASIAFCNNLILVTNNVSDFDVFDGLTIENWFLNPEEPEH